MPTRNESYEFLEQLGNHINAPEHYDFPVEKPCDVSRLPVAHQDLLSKLLANATRDALSDLKIEATTISDFDTDGKRIKPLWEFFECGAVGLPWGRQQALCKFFRSIRDDIPQHKLPIEAIDARVLPSWLLSQTLTEKLGVTTDIVLRVESEVRQGMNCGRTPCGRCVSGYTSLALMLCVEQASLLAANEGESPAGEPTTPDPLYQLLLATDRATVQSQRLSQWETAPGTGYAVVAFPPEEALFAVNEWLKSKKDAVARDTWQRWASNNNVSEWKQLQCASHLTHPEIRFQCPCYQGRDPLPYHLRVLPQFFYYLFTPYLQADLREGKEPPIPWVIFFPSSRQGHVSAVSGVYRMGPWFSEIIRHPENANDFLKVTRNPVFLAVADQNRRIINANPHKLLRLPVYDSLDELVDNLASQFGVATRLPHDFKQAPKDISTHDAAKYPAILVDWLKGQFPCVDLSCESNQTGAYEAAKGFGKNKIRVGTVGLLFSQLLRARRQAFADPDGFSFAIDETHGKADLTRCEARSLGSGANKKWALARLFDLLNEFSHRDGSILGVTLVNGALRAIFSHVNWGDLRKTYMAMVERLARWLWLAPEATGTYAAERTHLENLLTQEMNATARTLVAVQLATGLKINFVSGEGPPASGAINIIRQDANVILDLRP